MSDNNSLDWTSVLGAISDSDELMSMLINNEVKAEKPEGDQLQESSSKIQLQPPVLPYQNFHVGRHVGAGSSSFQTQNPLTRMITGGGSLMNPIGIPYRCQRQHVVPVAAPLGSGIHSSQELLIMGNISNNKRGRKKIHEAEERKRLNKIKNRISAAKSRAKRQEHTRFLEERVEQLKKENAQLRKLLSLDQEDAASETFPEEEEEDEGQTDV